MELGNMMRHAILWYWTMCTLLRSQLLNCMTYCINVFPANEIRNCVKYCIHVFRKYDVVCYVMILNHVRTSQSHDVLPLVAIEESIWTMCLCYDIELCAAFQSCDVTWWLPLVANLITETKWRIFTYIFYNENVMPCIIKWE